MGGQLRRIAAVAAACVAALALSGAQRPLALAPTQPGLWEVSGIPEPVRVRRVCVGDTAQLAQFEHFRASCTRVVLRNLPTSTEIQYTCTAGGFGRSKVTVITPRSLRIETQGISGNAPFYYVLQARRIGPCPRNY